MTSSKLPPTNSSASAGEVIGGHYAVLSLLGEGGFGKVWRVKETTGEGRELALKEFTRTDAVPTPQATGSSDAGDEVDEVARQIEREFLSLAKLKHKNIVKVHDYGVTPRGRYLVMELVSGRDLAKIIASGPMPVAEACRVLISIARALDLMHARLFVHCDIKSENVRITDAGDVKLMDFGLLHQLGTASTSVRGTAQYMAPEVLKGGVIDARTDLYSLGALAYEMFTGQLPFDGATHAEIVGKHLREKPREPSDLVDLPAAVDEVVLKLLAKEPADRFQNARALIERLAEIGGIDAAPEELSHRSSYLYSADLIGRDEQSEFLDDVRERLGRGEGSTVFIAGRAGEGKSRLLAEFSLRVRLDGKLFSVGRCQKEGLAPLAPMQEALSVLVGRTPDDVLKRYGDVLTLLLPELKARGFTPPAFTNALTAKLRMHEAASAWLAAVAAQQPFILCIEDLHWADGNTLELLNHLVRSRGDAPIVYMGTFRSDEVDRTSIVYATVDEGLTINLALMPLSRRDVDKLLKSTLAQHALPASFLASLYETTAGNAFFVVETLRYLVESSLIAQGATTTNNAGASAGGWTLAKNDVALPKSIAEVVTRRLEVLSPELLELCRALSPLGLVIDASLAQAVTGLATPALMERFDGLVERQYVQRVAGKLLFTHQTVRDAVYTGLAEQTRTDLHKKIGEQLEKNAKKDTTIAASQLAWHFKRGAEPDKAMRYFLAAGRAAAGNLQFVDATQLLAQGVELAEASKAKDRDTTLVTFYDMLVPVGMQGHPPTCAKAVDRLWEIWSSAGIDPDKVLSDARDKAERQSKLPKFMQKIVGPSKPAAFDPTTKDPGVIVTRMLAVKGTQAMALAAMGEADRSLVVASETMERLPDPMSPVRAALLLAKCIAFAHLGRFGEQLAAADEAIAIFENVEVPPNLRWHWALSYYFRTLSLSLQGNPVDRSEIKRAEELADKFEVLDAKGFAVWAVQCVATLAGTQGEFESLQAELEGLLRRLGYPRLLESRCRMFVPLYYLDRGQLELARASTEKIEALGKVMRDSWLLTYADVYRGLESLEQGRLDEAGARLEKAVGMARERKLGRLNSALCGLGQVHIARGDLASARTVLDETMTRAMSNELRCYYDEMVARRLLADVVTPEEARAHLESAIELAARMKNATQEGLAWAALARHRKRDGADVGDAKARAAALFRSVKNDFWLKRVEAL